MAVYIGWGSQGELELESCHSSNSLWTCQQGSAGSSACRSERRRALLGSVGRGEGRGERPRRLCLCSCLWQVEILGAPVVMRRRQSLPDKQMMYTNSAARGGETKGVKKKKKVTSVSSICLFLMLVWISVLISIWLSSLLRPSEASGLRATFSACLRAGDIKGIWGLPTQLFIRLASPRAL